MRILTLKEINSGKIRYANEQGTLVLTDSSDSIIEKGLISCFNRNDRKKIRENSNRNQVWREHRNIYWYSALTTIFTALLLIAIPLSTHPVAVLGTIQPGGIIIFPLSFVILDTINSTLRYSYAKYTVYLAASICILASLLLFITFYLFDINAKFTDVFKPLIKLYLINACCLLVADQVNNIVFRKLNNILSKRDLWIKCAVSTVTGQSLYTVIWIVLFFNTNASQELIQKIIDNYGFKLIYAAALIPVTYILVQLHSKLIISQNK